MSGKNFVPDRAVKYGYGTLRLLLIVVISFLVGFPDERPTDVACSNHGLVVDSSNLFHYIHSLRWIGHVYIGIIGAVVNVKLLGVHWNLALLGGAALLIFTDLYHNDFAYVVYILKTFCGDYLAGKLDTFEWKLTLTFGLLLPVVVSFWAETTHQVEAYSRILLLLFLIQLICEYGDNHWEHLKFFRYRYSFEVLTVLVLVGLAYAPTWSAFLPTGTSLTVSALTPKELDVIRFDLVICLFYRISNFVILMVVMQSEQIANFCNMFVFHCFGWYTGVAAQRVVDPYVAMLVLKGELRVCIFKNSAGIVGYSNRLLHIYTCM